MSKLHSFGGNIAIPIGGQFGFGLPSIGNDESTGPQLLTVTGNPNGVITAPIGSAALQLDAAALWQNTDGGTTWTNINAGASLEIIQQRIQLADLPSSDNTGVVSFGASIAANRVVLSSLLYLNADVDVGGSGIGVVNITAGAAAANLFTTVDVVGESGTPKYLTSFTNPTDFSPGPFASPTAGSPVYQISSDGPDLDTLVAFDVTILVLVSPTTLSVP